MWKIVRMIHRKLCLYVVIIAIGLVNINCIDADYNKDSRISESMIVVPMEGGDTQQVLPHDRQLDSSGKLYIATTPSIPEPSTERPESRYEKGLEDYDEAVARVELVKEKLREKERQRQLSKPEPIDLFSLFSVLDTAWYKVGKPDVDDNTEDRQKRDLSEYGDGQWNQDITGPEDVVTENVSGDGNNNTALVEEGRYIKGDPLKGYYDFIITEGSYKFWAAFQLATAALMIYSTFAAIYYSKVNPITADYDYVDYLGGGRSMADAPEPTSSTNSSSDSSILSYWHYLFDNNNHTEWIEKASHGFQFVLNAIEKMPVSDT